MKGLLLDTNIPSEMTRPRPEPSVSGWLDDADDDRLYFSVVSLGEVLKGVTVLPESKRRAELQQGLDETLRPWFEGRILPVNEPIAERWGVLAGQCQLKGSPLKVADGFIAATALEHDLTIVTRNVKDFARSGRLDSQPVGSGLIFRLRRPPPACFTVPQACCLDPSGSLSATNRQGFG